MLETEANGVNLGLQLADGLQVQFDSTGRVADWLYAVAVQQGQATQFVTDNDYLDIQWLNTVDQKLLNEAVSCSAVGLIHRIATRPRLSRGGNISLRNKGEFT